MAKDTRLITQSLASLPAKAEPPVSARVLDTWIQKADLSIVPGGTGGRLRWLIASTVVTAALQRAVDADQRALFLVKGGTLLQHRLGLAARSTRDLDGLVRGDLDAFVAALDQAFDEPWGPLELTRGPVEVINTPERVVKPRRFDVRVTLRGKVWARIQVEVAPEEAGAGDFPEPVKAPSLGAFGLPEPGEMAALAMRFQIIQKLHAATDPHHPPEQVNTRSRDLVDLVMLEEFTAASGSPSLAELRHAGQAIFEARATDARALGRTPRSWPPVIIPFEHWEKDFGKAATSAGITLTMADAATRVNDWITRIAAA